MASMPRQAQQASGGCVAQFPGGSRQMKHEFLRHGGLLFRVRRAVYFPCDGTLQWTFWWGLASALR